MTLGSVAHVVVTDKKHRLAGNGLGHAVIWAAAREHNRALEDFKDRACLDRRESWEKVKLK